MRKWIVVAFEVLACAWSVAGGVRLWPGDTLNLQKCPGGKWPGWHLDAVKGVLDWRNYTSFEIVLSNRTAHAVRVCVSVKGDALQGRSPEGALELPPSGEGKFVCDLKPEPWRLDKPIGLVGMRGYPQAGGESQVFDLSRVSSIHVFRQKGDSPDDFEILSVKALDEKREQIVFKADGFLPFVDRFGQFKHLDWPGKVHAEGDLARAREDESKWLAGNAAGPDPDRDKYGGWAKGPQLKATGFFRTEKVDGKRWFVDPEGHLFWSLGIDCLNVGEGVTGIGFREAYFEWLPAKDDPSFGQFYGKTGWKAAHGFYAETNHVPYATYNFAAANMLRKYGGHWRESSVDLAHRRLKAWGVNTVGNWSQPEIYLARRTPYTVCLSTAGAPRLAGSKGWWGPLPDPGHPEFARKLRERARRMAAKMKDDPWCIGVFVDNELSWNDLPGLADVAERYYATVGRIVREELPNHLYLGSRIAWGSPAVYRACARHADVVSVNVYAAVFDRDLPADAVDKPLLNGEFHFGALDRGLFHAGLVPVKDQAARAGAFKTYVRSCLENPRVIGTHWFQWKDQPLTGRSDGENYQIGFLNVADAPYPEMVEAVREVSATMYPSRTVKFEREILVEAEDFTKKGGWKVDTQFTHKMGSAYLIAASAGRPVADAVTAVEIPEGGVWRCWVRTKDWVPAHHPGRFAVSIGGKESRVLGASGASGWRWEGAGEFALPAGKVELRLVDKSGWFARCDAVMLTKGDAAPPQVNRLDGPSGVTDGGEYDVVVVGAGTAGTCAAIAAARSGAGVALVHDRPVLGGNASSEIKVQIEGASVEHPNARETGIIEEAQLLRLALGKNATISDAFRALAERERRLAVFDSSRVMRVEKEGRRMSAVIARGTLDGKWTRYRGKMFIDCTGDGWLGWYAGLPYMTGREAKSEFNEAEAPDVADAVTMSGCISDGKFRFNSVVRDAPVKFETPAWAKVLPPGFTRKLKPVLHQYGGFSPMWWMEHPGDVDDFEDPEFARDELIRYYVAFWGWGKNEWEHRALLANEELLTIPFIDGRRETLRLVGDYVMTGNDEKSARMFPDRISYGGWPMDTHDPLGMKAVTSDGYWKHHPPLPIYSIPYRVLYSPSLDNFFFAGRCQSATHMALGSIRVMSTLATLGQVCGTAAAECVRRGETPREFGERHIAELQQRLLKDDMYIPAIENEDPLDVARTATAAASSSGERMYFRTSEPVEWFTKTHHIAHPSKRVGHDGWLYVEGATPQNVVDGISRPVLDIAHGWASDAAKPLPQWIRLDFAKPAMIGQVRITFNSDLQQRKPDAPMPRTLAKAYRVEVLSGGEWRKVAEVKDNWRRLAVHDFPRCEAAAVRVTVTETWGDPRAQIFEIRAYDFELGVARSIEVPFANANGVVVTPETCRELGRDLAKTIKAYLEEQA